MPSCAKLVETVWTKHGKKCVHSSTASHHHAAIAAVHVGNTRFIHTYTHSQYTLIPQAIFAGIQRYIHTFPQLPHPLLLPPLNK